MGRRIENLRAQLQEIEHYIPNFETKNLNVSKATVGWQLDHALKVIIAVSIILVKTDPKKYKRDINIRKLVLFAFGTIPRGKGRSPKQVLPPEIILKEDLYTQLKSAREYVQKIEKVHKNAYFNHHIFGTLNKDQTTRFLNIHTRHHLKIIEDIINEK